MKIEFPALQSEPLIYFLVHGGVFVLVMGTLFFILGLWLGSAIWGRYKVRAKTIRAENEAQREEIATLKRKLAEQSMRSSTGPLPPVPHLLTEVLPRVADVFPERRFEYPALAALPKQPEEKKPEAPKPASSEPATVSIGKSSSRKSTIKAKTKSEAPAAPTPPAPPASDAPAITEEADAIEPFGFLLGEPAEPAAISTPSTSALTAIIKGSSTAPLIAAPSEPAIAPAAPPDEPAASVLSLMPDVPVVQPEFDAALGLIYKQTPPDADDLTKIKGIATVLEKRLHELGIHTYRQIASWEDRHIREFSSRLAFKDRIARERWVEQARSLNEARQSA